MSQFQVNVNVRSRADLAVATRRLVEPLLPYFTSEGSGILPGVTGAAYAQLGAKIEGLARPLWALGPLAAGGFAFDHWPRWRAAIAIGVDPDQPGYWGTPGDSDQRYVENASIATTLLLAPKELWEPLDARTKERLLEWLGRVNRHEISANNWRFFRVLANLALRRLGAGADEARLREDFDLIDKCYLGEGWYSDGLTDQRDHYIPFAMHYYGLVYSVFAKDVDPDRAKTFRDRAARFAQDFAVWFDADGPALPYGRSLSYRFAHAGLWAALAFAGVEALPWGQIKGLFLRNLRWWFAQPILIGDGTLSIGYAYPNLIMAEQYNSPSSPYWAMKAMLPLALADDHPFWRAEEAPVPPHDVVSAQPHARMLVRRSANGHVVALSAGQYLTWAARHAAQKYAKFAYSTRYGFNCGIGDDIAFDGALALSDDAGTHWRFRRKAIERSVDARQVVARSTYFDDVEVTTTLRFGDDGSHVREHRVKSGRKLWSGEGGFAFDTTDVPRSAREIQEIATREAGPRRAMLKLGGRSSWIVDDSPEVVRTSMYTHDQPNQNILFPRSMTPVLRGEHGPGEFVLRCRVGVE